MPNLHSKIALQVVRLREKPVIAAVFDFLTDLFDALMEQR